MGKNKEINAIPVTPFFYEPVEVESKTDVKSMPKLEADVNVKEIPKVVTEGTTTVESLPKIETEGSVDIKSVPTIDGTVSVTELPKGEADVNVKEIPALNVNKHDVDVNVQSSNDVPIHFVVDNADEFGVSNIQMNATVNDSTGTPNVEVTKSGDSRNPIFDLEFSGLKGDNGATPNIVLSASANSGSTNIPVTVSEDSTSTPEEPHIKMDFDFTSVSGDGNNGFTVTSLQKNSDDITNSQFLVQAYEALHTPYFVNIKMPMSMTSGITDYYVLNRLEIDDASQSIVFTCTRFNVDSNTDSNTIEFYILTVSKADGTAKMEYRGYDIDNQNVVSSPVIIDGFPSFIITFIDKE